MIKKEEQAIFSSICKPKPDFSRQFFAVDVEPSNLSSPPLTPPQIKTMALVNLSFTH